MTTRHWDNTEAPYPAIAVLAALLLLGERTVERRAIRSLLPPKSKKLKAKGHSGTRGDHVTRVMKEALYFLEHKEILLRFPTTVLVLAKPAQLLENLKDFLSRKPSDIHLVAEVLERFSAQHQSVNSDQEKMKITLQALVDEMPSQWIPPAN